MKRILSAKKTVILMIILLISISIAYSTTFTFSAPTSGSKVKAGDTDVLLYQFYLNSTDSTITGSEPAAGTAITNVTPWIAVYFYDNGNSAWSSADDWIGLDPDEDEVYTSEADTEVDCDGNTTTGSGVCSSSPGDALTEMINTDKICTDDLINPTIVFISSAGDCAFNGSVDIELLGGAENITYTLVAAGDDWAYNGAGAYSLGNEIFIDIDGGLTYSDSADTTITGTAPAAETAITNTNPLALVYFYDEGDALWNESDDWIGESEDGFYLDTINSLLINNTGTANQSDVVNVTLYEGSGCSGTNEILEFNGTNICPEHVCWYSNSIDMDINESKVFTICGDITSGASNGRNIRMTIENDNIGFVSGDTLPLADEGVTGVITIDTVNPQVTGITSSIPMITNADIGSELNITITFSEDMDTSIDLLPLGVTPDLTGTSLPDCSSSGWASATKYSYLCTINDSNEEFDEVNITVDAAEDEAGNLQVANTTVGLFAVDTKEPSVQFIDPTTAEGTLAQDYIQANVSVADSDLDLIIVRLYNSTNGIVDTNLSSSSPFFTIFTSLPSGTYYMNATVNDTNGNINYSETLEITLDTTKPAPTGDYEANPEEISISEWGDNFLFSFNWSEAMNTSVNPTLEFAPVLDELMIGCSGI